MTAPPARRVLLLRGVNVGGRRVPMAELRAQLEARLIRQVHGLELVPHRGTCDLGAGVFREPGGSRVSEQEILESNDVAGSPLPAITVTRAGLRTGAAAVTGKEVDALRIDPSVLQPRPVLTLGRFGSSASRVPRSVPPENKSPTVSPAA